MQPEAQGIPNPKGPSLAPKLVFPNNRVMNDSTMLIKELEGLYPERSVLPNRPGLRLICSLLEDFCDEWLTKAMFHFRWTYDIETAGFGIGSSIGFNAGIDNIKQFGSTIGARQVGRLGIVGSNEETGPIIEKCFERLCALLESHFESGHAFLLGSRPSAADFALYGQLHPMISMDPETSSRVFKASRTVWFWYHSMKDLSGLSIADEDEGWLVLSDEDGGSLPPTLSAILGEVGRFYVPFMLANARAIERGEGTVDALLDGEKVRWTQPSFKYQAKCLTWLVEEYGELSVDETNKVNRVLGPAGCMALFEGSPAAHTTQKASRL
jgi:glutathione S-transferase